MKNRTHPAGVGEDFSSTVINISTLLFHEILQFFEDGILPHPHTSFDIWNPTVGSSGLPDGAGPPGARTCSASFFMSK
jgi:hypothetical protein